MVNRNMLQSLLQFPARKNSRNKISTRQRRMRVEPLESRRMLAGVCELDFDDGVLEIECDDADNDITITGTGATGGVMITGIPGTTFNPAAPTMFTGVEDIDIEMDDGDDVVLVDDIDITGDLTIDGGDDSNTNIVQDSTIGDDVEIENGDTDHSTDHDGMNGGFDGFTGQYNLVHDTT